ncbi:hypothetical protein HNR61_004567 [Actinomadura namibiensis]|uniref:Uncharacterized protein n=1 Tax=Actinomadura namibiensis TaxID=182080 RepID=A0A7W3LRC7_ACTNM|nr:hypothetical protein [Actinomadura namibiensis]
MQDEREHVGYQRISDDRTGAADGVTSQRQVDLRASSA